jgi:outer membrane lipoprotein carrier protein
MGISHVARLICRDVASRDVASNVSTDIQLDGVGEAAPELGILATLRRLVLPLAAVAVATLAWAGDVASTARAVDDKYNHLKTLQADFSEIYRGAGTERMESGTLLLKKPGKMRWDYRSPKEKLFVSDGRDVWFWVPGDRQVQRSKLKRLEDLRSPIGFLLGKAKLEKELRGLSEAPDVAPLEGGDKVLRGVPQALAERVSQVTLEITPEDWIRRIVIEEVDGSVTEYRFSDQKADVDIPESRFRFEPPPGVEVIDGELGQ